MAQEPTKHRRTTAEPAATDTPRKPKARRPKATTPKEVRKLFRADCKAFRKKSRKAVRRKLAFTSADQAVLDCLSGRREQLSLPIASNLALREKLAELLLPQLTGLAQTPQIEIGWLTVLSRDFETGSEDTEVDLRGMQRVFRPVLNAIFPNYLAVAEQQMFTNVKMDGKGLLVSPHLHVVGWGVGIKAEAERQLSLQRAKYQTRFPDVDSLHLRWAKTTPLDLARLAYYPWKPPHRCKTLYKNDITGRANLHESEANDRYVNYLRYLEILSLIPVGAMMFGYGQGQSMRADMLREAKSWLKTGAATRNPPIHVDGIPQFWSEFMPRMGLERFKLPLIKLH